MKAITIWQPWASLLAAKEKMMETRSWETNYRGPIAIHAATRKFQREEMQYFAFHMGKEVCDALCKEVYTQNAQIAFVQLMETLPYGAVIATANLVGCHKIDQIRELEEEPWQTGYWNELNNWFEAEKKEILFGDWTPGRYAWEFEDMKMLPEPRPAKGAQGLWNWGDIA